MMSNNLGSGGGNPFQPPAYMQNGGGGMNWGNMVGGLGNIAGGLFAGNQHFNNPADAASPYFQQIPGTMKPYYDPYINAGHQAMGNLQGQYGQLTNDPGGKMNQIGQGFHQSPGFQFQVDQATGAANRAAAAGGMLGSPMEQQQLAGTVNGLANQDYYNWMNGAMGLYGQGLQGQQDINHMGYGASDSLAQSLANALMSQGSLAYAGQANQNQAQQGQNGDMLSGLINGAGSIASMAAFL